jgi:hypothetical protein
MVADYKLSDQIIKPDNVRREIANTIIGGIWVQLTDGFLDRHDSIYWDEAAYT